jgi:hypothetical protein
MFQAHLALLQLVLSRRDDVVESIQGLLNAQRKPAEYLRDAALLSDLVEDCLFGLAGAPLGHSRLRGQLEDAHRASGFTPRVLPGLRNGLIDPGEMMIRAFHLWQRTRWPGRNGRLRFAQTLFNLEVLRRLELLSVRLWDEGASAASERLVRMQAVLDQLWATSPADQPVLLRDARWLIPLAQSPATDDLGAYFVVAERIAASLSHGDRLAVHHANVRMAAGHLRAQIRYYSAKEGVRLDDSRVVLNTRSSNALDFALLVQDLVPLLDAYELACRSDDAPARLELADSICQGLSPDPELFVNRVELLGAYSMIEPLFVTTDPDGRAVYTPVGRRHVDLFHDYAARIGRVSKRLLEDCRRFRPVAGGYSPYGVLYGFSTDLIEHMAFKTSLPEAAARFGLEDVFVGGGADQRAWVDGWRRLPHLPAEVARQFDYPQQFAEDIFTRIEAALRRRATDEPIRTGRLVVVRDDAAQPPDAVKAEPYDQAQLLSDRREGRCLLSYQTPGGWMAIRKTILSDVLGAGRDANVVGLPPAAVRALALLCPGLAG